MTNSDIKTYAKNLAEILLSIDDLKISAKGILDDAKDAGINTKALATLAKEMNTESEKLRKQYEDEAQLELFRDQVGIHRMKNLEEFAKVDA